MAAGAAPPKQGSGAKFLATTSRAEQGGFRTKSGGGQHGGGDGGGTPGGRKSTMSMADCDRRGSVDCQQVTKLNAVAAVPVTDTIQFNVTVVVICFLNILFICLEMDLGPGRRVALLDRFVWYFIEAIFSVCFLVEILIRFQRLRHALFQDFWNVLDVVIVGVACFDTLVLSPAGVGGHVRFFTVLRILRAVRVVGLVRTFPAFRELWLLVGGFRSSIKALAWVGCIILLVLYVSSIVVTVEIGQNDEAYGVGPSYDGHPWPHRKYFGSVFRSMFTLFQIMTLDGWCDDIVRHVVFRQPLMGVFFVGFLFFAAFGLMKLVVGIIVESTLAAAQVSDRRVDEVRGQTRKEAVERLHEILAKSDANRTGEISLQEMKAAYQSRVVQEELNKIGLNFSEVQEIFKLLDYEQRGRVELARFADSCRELVGGQKRRDLAQVEVTVGALAQHLERLDRQFTRIETDITELTAMANHFVHNTVRVLTGFDGSVGVPSRPDLDAMKADRLRAAADAVPT